MTATILPLPPFSVRVIREDDGAWLVLAGRGNGWVHGSRSEAFADAAWLSRSDGVPIVDRSERRP